jgi:superfamily II DNA or RNA helicase
VKSSEWFGRGRPCDLARSAQGRDDILKDERHELHKQNGRAAGLYRRLYEEGAPGVLLADEVGKGKTYVALGVAFALLAEKLGQHHDARVVVLTHSAFMAKAWADRWAKHMKENCPEYKQYFDGGGKWRPVRFTSFDDLRAAYDAAAPPPLAVGSYETLKKYVSKFEEASILYALLKWTNDCHHVYLSKSQRHGLVRKVIGGFDFRTKLSPASKFAIVRSEAHRFLRECFDPIGKDWRPSAQQIRDRIDELVAGRHCQKLAHQIDLLIIDEAHKFESEGRQRVITRLLHKRFRKCLFVTATPFALSVEQFRNRLLEFQHASPCARSFVEEIDRLPLKEFERAVGAGEDYPDQRSLEKTLRKYMVRDTWDHDKVRMTDNWKASAQPDAIVPTLMLERIIDSVLSENGQTHIASRRESLCSSWAAAVTSLEKSPIKSANGWSERFREAVSSGSSGIILPDPKMLEAASKLAALALNGEKAVVFTQRSATAKLLQKRLSAQLTSKTIALSQRGDYWRRQTDRLGSLLGINARAARVLAKILAHSPDAPERWNPGAVRSWWDKHKSRAFSSSKSNEDSLIALEGALGSGRRLPLVVRFDSDGGTDDAHPIEKFNLPSAPLILISTPKGQEGIDLHRYCRRVVLYDLTWNPAHMEQRIGRVHRLGGAHSKTEKIEVVYCYQDGTYEAIMAKRVQERCRMLRVLLGAGQWLDEDKELENIDRYRMSFPP